MRPVRLHGVLLLAALAAAAPGVGAGEARYLEIVFAESVDEAALGSLLKEAGAAEFVGETTAWAYISDFAGLRPLTLAEYARTVLPKDPRNDGYAAAARAFFVHDGKRRIFVPVAGDEAVLARTLEAALAGIDHTVLTGKKPLSFRAPKLPALPATTDSGPLGTALFFLALSLTLLLAFRLERLDVPLVLALTFTALFPLVFRDLCLASSLAALFLLVFQRARSPLSALLARRLYAAALSDAPPWYGKAHIRFTPLPILPAAVGGGRETRGAFPLLPLPYTLMAAAVLAARLWGIS